MIPRDIIPRDIRLTKSQTATSPFFLLMMDSILDISDFIGEDFEAAGINFFEFAPWTPDYLLLLGELWILDSGDPDPDHALTLVTVMVYMADEADAGLCEALS